MSADTFTRELRAAVAWLSTNFVFGDCDPAILSEAQAADAELDLAAARGELDRTALNRWIEAWRQAGFVRRQES